MKAVLAQKVFVSPLMRQEGFAYRIKSQAIGIDAQRSLLHKSRGRFTAPVLFEGACDALAFNAWLENVLCPLLDASHVVILDNASFHKSQQTEALIAACGASLLFLPPYSPELNPIERDFANIKRKWEYNAEASIDEIVKMYK